MQCIIKYTDTSDRNNRWLFALLYFNMIPERFAILEISENRYLNIIDNYAEPHNSGCHDNDQL